MMKKPPAVLLLFLLILCGVMLLSGSRSFHAQSADREPLSPVLQCEFGFSEDGAITHAWLAAVRYLRNDAAVSAGQFNNRQLSEAELPWVALITGRIPAWIAVTDSLGIPFSGIAPPDTVTILIGNQGGEDAFLYREKTICFDVQRLSHIYGAAAEPANSDRIDRFFAHEFTHVLHKTWLKMHPLMIDTPLDAALWECLSEGLGNYRSLSGKWLTDSGELTEHARTVLGRLQPVFVERISALKHANAEDVSVLMKGLSMGPFEQKWGALTVALWLAQEANGNDANLQKWVAAGPAGVLTLAQKYLPENLKTEFIR